MRKPPAYLDRFQSNTLSANRQITILPDSILVEDKSGANSAWILGGLLLYALMSRWQPVAHVFWDEVRAVYAWEAPNWDTVVLGGIFGGLFVLLGAIMATSDRAGFVFLLIGLAIIGLCWWIGAKLRPRRWIKLETEQGPIAFHTRRPRVRELILSHLQLQPPAVSGPFPTLEQS